MHYSKYQIKWKSYLLFNMFQAFAMLVTLERDGVSWELHLLHNMAVTAWSKGNNLLCSALTEQCCCCCFPGHGATICCLSWNTSPPMRVPAPDFQVPKPSGSKDREIVAWSLKGFFLSHVQTQNEDHIGSLWGRQTCFPLFFCNVLVVSTPSISIYSIWCSHPFSLASGGYVVPCCRSKCLWQGWQVHCYRCLGSYFYRSHSMLSVVRKTRKPGLKTNKETNKEQQQQQTTTLWRHRKLPHQLFRGQACVWVR